MNRKVLVAAEFIGLLLAFYVFFKYIFILIWPLALSASLALLLYPLIHFIHKKCKINQTIVTILILVGVFAAVFFLCFFLCRKLMEQVNLFVENYDYYQKLLGRLVVKTCCRMENILGANRGCILKAVTEQLEEFADDTQKKLVNYVMVTSLPAVKTIVDVMVGTVVVIVAFFLMVKDMEKLKHQGKQSLYGKELSFVYQRVKRVFKAYIKAQLIIMTVVAALSVLGLTLSGFDYAWLVGIGVGILDALPLFGAGIVLVPITLYYAITKKILKAIILFITFLACYFAREYLEPKLMGDKMGVNALTMLIGIYVGYRLFGFLGMFAGAFSVIFLSDLLKQR